MIILRARYVLPVVRPPIENGAVAIEGTRVAFVGGWPELKRERSGPVVDLGDSVVMPGLVNAHCHLDYTDLAGKIPPPRNFADWIKAIVALKAQMLPDDFRRSWQQGAAMLLQSGTTTVADIEAVPELLPAIWQTTPLRVISFRELICLKSGPPASETVQNAVGEMNALPGAEKRLGLSPHTPYTTTPELLQAAARAAEAHDWRLVIHVAESEPEFEMFMYRQGALYEWLKSQRDMSDCGHGSPVQHLARCGCLSPRLLAVHANYLARDDAANLGRHGASVVHCPLSHAYFRHLRFPLKELTRHGVNVCLGTDSLASTAAAGTQSLALDMFAEMRALHSAKPDLAPATILGMATVNGAQALGREGQLGQLSEDAFADLIAIPWRDQTANIHAVVLQHSGPVQASMMNGNWVIEPSS